MSDSATQTDPPRAAATRERAAVLFDDHPDRAAAIAEAHARPPIALPCPSTLHHLALSYPAEDGGRTLYQTLFGTARNGDVPRHTVMTRDGLTIKWERHTEFASITLISSGASARDAAETFLSEVAQATSAANLVVALRAKITGGTSALEPATHAFGGQLRGGIDILSTFHVGEDGYVDFRIVVPDDTVGPDELGRRVQRVFEMETYRTMALLGLPEARRIGPELSALEGELQAITDSLNAGNVTDAAILERLQSLSMRVEAMRSRTRFRFSASKAYAALVDERLESLAETRVATRPSLSGFTRTRLRPAVRTILSTETRQTELSEAVSRTLDFLRARISVSMDKANQDIMRSMNERQHRQLVLSEAVESLSVIAISYYLLGILSYPIASLKELGALPVSETVTLGVLAPVVALCVFAALRRLRSALMR